MTTPETRTAAVATQLDRFRRWAADWTRVEREEPNSRRAYDDLYDGAIELLRNLARVSGDLIDEPTSFEQSVDQAIARHQAEFAATVCPWCLGTGRVGHQRTPCDRCDATGKRPPAITLTVTLPKVRAALSAVDSDTERDTHDLGHRARVLMHYLDPDSHPHPDPA
ncbi:hypothetical protein ACIA49_39115 [Kribbella sp. NPDC051587]|uniref:hypothetical protein n=1 Tax=Kribbella sp. NPDC051587 TaxID=3364119 RepID=UPI0037BA5882